MVPFAISTTPLRADEHQYHDTDHNDDHVWNAQEDRAYRTWVKENHRRYENFSKLREEDQKAYWTWRHEHPDNDHRKDDRH
jgi:hypothetical protein